MIGKYCIIDKSVKIGKETIIRNYVEIRKGVEIGKGCYIDSGVCFTGDAIIGDFVKIRNQSVIARGSEIGDHTIICPHVMFNNLDQNQQGIGGGKVGKRCFVGTGTIIQHGVEIGDHTVVGANSFVNKDISGGVWAGTPVRKIRDNILIGSIDGQ